MDLSEFVKQLGQSKTFHLEELPEGKMKVTGNCIVTGEPYSVICSVEGYRKWVGGEYIQHALKELSPQDREFLLSGTSPAGWKKLFGDDPDEKEGD